jgi:threonine dehydrogenase-like Zn-dependent dehydrogenase
MRAAFLTGGRRVELREISRPDPDAGEVRVAVRSAGICGSDLNHYRLSPQELDPARAGSPCGHEAAGVVDALGPGVSGLEEGDRVSVYHYVGCGHCCHCLCGEVMMCSEARGIDAMGAGANAEYLVVPARNCLPLPDRLSFVTGSFIACVAGTAFSALRRLRLPVGSRLAVLGLGPLGLTVVEMARAMGVRVLGIDPRADRRQLAGEIGAEVCLDPSAPETLTEVQRWGGAEGVRHLVEASGAAAALELAVGVAAPNAHVIVLGLHNPEGPALSGHQILMKQLNVQGSRVMPIHLHWELTELLLESGIDFTRVVTETFPLEEISSALDRADCDAAGKVMIDI